MKSSATLASHFLDDLQTFESEVRERFPHLDVESRLVYGGDDAHPRSGVTVLPWSGIQGV